jgi:hypothetical protein
VDEAMMRGVKSLLVLVVILAGLGAYIYFVESKRDPASESADKKEKAFAVEAEKIDELQLTSGSGPAATLRKANGAWSMVEPEATRADETEASNIASNLASLEIQRVVDENPASLGDYGLSTPRAVVAFKGQGDKDYRRLIIGDKTPTGGDLYAKFGDSNRVFLIASYLETTFNRTPFDLRDKTLVTFDRDKTDRVEIVSGRSVLHLARAGGEWSIVNPIRGRGDYGTIEGLITRLQSARMKSIVPADAKSLRQYGLDRPTSTISFLAGSARSTLAFGKPSPDGTVYARDESRPIAFTVDALIADDLKKPVDDFRRKDVFEFRTYNASRFEIARAGATRVFEKQKGAGENAATTWAQVSPAAKLDSGKIDEFLGRVSNFRAQAFVDAKARTNLQAPEATVTVKFDDSKKEERVSFGRAGTDVFAGRADEAGAARIDAADFDATMKLLDELK